MTAKLEPLSGTPGGESAQSFASVPLPLTMPQIAAPASAPSHASNQAYAPNPAPVSASVPGAALSSLIQAVAPAAVAATMMPPPRMPMPAYHPEIPVRQVPVALMETHHNILHPHGLWVKHVHR